MLKDLKEVKLAESEHKLLENGWGYEIANNIETYEFFYNSDDESVKGYLSFPKDNKDKLPVIIWNRGGDNKSGLLDDFLASGILGEIASWGYIVFASQYRKKDEFGGKDINDVLNLIDEAKKYKFSDEDKIGMEGWSRGGMMSYLTLTKTQEIKCCIVVAGLSNLIRNESENNKLAKVYENHFGVDDEEEFARRKKNRSAIFWADKINKNTNILFIHGTADDKISAEDSIEMYKRLSELNVDTKYELKLINNGDHYLRKDRKNISKVRKNWFDSYLKIKN
jgi:dipeptidyl aminopeptidase/acylaminoacyl peptidase